MTLAPNRKHFALALKGNKAKGKKPCIKLYKCQLKRCIKTLEYEKNNEISDYCCLCFDQ